MHSEQTAQPESEKRDRGGATKTRASISWRNRIFIIVASLLLAATLAVVCSPFLIAKGVQSWCWWKTRGTNFTIRFDKIEAPFLQPIILRGVRLQTTPTSAVRIDVTAARVTFGLNVRSILWRTRGRTLRSLLVQGLHVEVQRKKTGEPISVTAWNVAQRLLPESFDLQSVDVRLETESALALMRGVNLSGTPVAAGRFEVAEITISSPMFRQTFSKLVGATDWQSERLTIAALTLARGLDVQSINLDLSHLGKRRMSSDFDLDAFGGKLRGSVASEWRSQKPNWNMAGSASDISLSQTAEALGFTDRVGGLLHAGKFTYRGHLGDALTGTAGLWAELTGPAWRDREADVIMVGLSLYGRQLELQQLYIKQRRNQLTLNGESSFPTTAAGWLQPDLRGNVSASIDDLGDFASLFGANREDFAGRIEVQGTFNARDRKVGGNLFASGSGLTMFKESIDEFQTTFNLNREAIEILQMELKRNNDSLYVQGKIDISAEHNYSGSIDATLENVVEYFGDPHAKTRPISATLHSNITSSVWEAHAVFDPAESKPIEIAATFPLRIGQPLSALWTSPLTLTASIPALQLVEIPMPESFSRFQSGTASGQLTITETLRHPRVTGQLNLMNVRYGLTEFDGRAHFEGNHATIESLTLGNKQQNASFFGEIDLQDTQQLSVQLLPNQPLLDLTASIPLMDCVNRIEVRSVEPTPVQPLMMPGPPAAVQPFVSALELTGSAINGAWQARIQENDSDRLLGSAVPPSTAKTFRFCHGVTGAEPNLILGISAAASPTPTPTPQPVKKRKRRG